MTSHQTGYVLRKIECEYHANSDGCDACTPSRTETTARSVLTRSTSLESLICFWYVSTTYYHTSSPKTLNIQIECSSPHNRSNCYISTRDAEPRHRGPSKECTETLSPPAAVPLRLGGNGAINTIHCLPISQATSARRAFSEYC